MTSPPFDRQTIEARLVRVSGFNLPDELKATCADLRACLAEIDRLTKERDDVLLVSISNLDRQLSASQARADAAEAEIDRLKIEIDDAREACPVIRRQDYADAPLIVLVNNQVNQLFRMESRAEKAEALLSRYREALEQIGNCMVGRTPTDAADLAVDLARAALTAPETTERAGHSQPPDQS